MSTPSTGLRALELLERLRTGLPKGGEERQGQKDMTMALSVVLDNGGTTIVQAPTGVGKSIAYLSAALASNKKVVVATSSIALQDQLWNKDLPFISQRLPERELSFSVLKGRSNYLCRAALAEASGLGQDRRAVRQRLEGIDDDVLDKSELEAIRAWLETTETGDRAELSFEPSARTWSALSTSAEECPGRQACPYGNDCFAEQARARAESASVVVVNTHLYAMHVASQGWLLPDHDAVVFDEAHEVESVFTHALGAELGAYHVEALARAARRVLADDGVINDVLRSAQLFASTLAQISQEARPGASPSEVALPEGARGDERLAVAIDAIGRALVPLQRDLEAIPSDAPEAVRTRARRATLAAAAMTRRLAAVSATDDDIVVWISTQPTLRAVPIEVGEALESWFWSGVTEDESDEPDATGEEAPSAPRAVIFTSATIPATLRARLHVPDPLELAVDSPFDFASQGLLYVPRIPDPRRDSAGWKQAVRDELAALINAAGGRTLALFTSLAAMREAAEALRSNIGFPILVQGDQPKQTLLQAFADDESTCLFATRSFFQGIDVPGSSLSVVALDRIPFPHPGDPLIEAWQDAAGGGFVGFSEVAIPIAAIVLAQAAGRLIRSTSDRGVVAVLDSRLAEANYRRQLLDALPGLRRTRDQPSVLSFLKDAVRT